MVRDDVPRAVRRRRDPARRRCRTSCSNTRPLARTGRRSSTGRAVGRSRTARSRAACRRWRRDSPGVASHRVRWSPCSHRTCRSTRWRSTASSRPEAPTRRSTRSRRRGHPRAAGGDASARFLITVPHFLDRALPAARDAGVERVFVLGGEAHDGTEPFASLLDAGAGPRRPSPSGRRVDRGAADVERHHGLRQGGAADAAQPGRQRRAVRRGDQHHRGRRDDRRPAVLPHLRVDGPGEPRAPQGRHGRHDAALRPGGVPHPAAGASRDVRLPRAADRARAREAPARRQLRPVRPGARDHRRRAPRRRTRRGSRTAGRLGSRDTA